MNDLEDMTLRDAVFSGQLSSGHDKGNVSGTNIQDDCLRDLGTTARLSTWPSLRIFPSATLIPLCGTSLANHVLRVFFVRPQKQMGRIHAVANIAPVTHAKTMGDRSNLQFISNAMSEQGLIDEVISNAKSTISSASLAGFPQPASPRNLIDLLPKPFIDWALAMMLSHKKTARQVSARAALWDNSRKLKSCVSDQTNGEILACL